MQASVPLLLGWPLRHYGFPHHWGLDYCFCENKKCLCGNFPEKASLPCFNNNLAQKQIFVKKN
jgi:hypothetical protein